MIEASRIAAGRIFGVFWEVSGTEGTLYMDGERFNELQVYRFNDDKHDRALRRCMPGARSRPMPASSASILAAAGWAILTSR